MSGPTVGATWVVRGTTAASKAARAMWMDVHHGELARCVEAALAAVAPLIAAQERERCAKVCAELRSPDYSAENADDWCAGTEAAAAAILALEAAT